MIQASIVMYLIQSPQSASLGIARTVHATVNARLLHEAGAHEARLERHVYRATGKPPAAKLTRGLLECDKLRMSCRVMIDLSTVMPPGNDFAIVGDDSPDGYLTE